MEEAHAAFYPAHDNSRAIRVSGYRYSSSDCCIPHCLMVVMMVIDAYHTTALSHPGCKHLQNS